jgi:hypothetical protein
MAFTLAFGPGGFAPVWPPTETYEKKAVTFSDDGPDYLNKNNF